MNVFYCSSCNGYSVEAYAKTHLIVDATVKLAQHGDTVARLIGGEYPCVETRSLKCEQCQAAVVVKEMTKCPHNWEYSGVRRDCQICHKHETGRVVFADKK